MSDQKKIKGKTFIQNEAERLSDTLENVLTKGSFDRYVEEHFKAIGAPLTEDQVLALLKTPMKTPESIRRSVRLMVQICFERYTFLRVKK